MLCSAIPCTEQESPDSIVILNSQRVVNRDPNAESLSFFGLSEFDLIFSAMNRREDKIVVCLLSVKGI